jgi:ABC-type antimicrobial peptide transport system permease subunit
MNAIVMSTLLFVVLGIVMCVCFLIRNLEVAKFLSKINKLSYYYTRENKNLQEDGWDRFYKRLPSYDKMLYNIYSLRYETFFDKEDCVELKRLEKQYRDSY